MRPNGKCTRGQVIPMIAVLLVALVAAAGLAVDIGYSYVVKANLTAAVDAAALAAARASVDNAGGAANRLFDANFPPRAMMSISRELSAPVVDGEYVTLTGQATVPTLFMRAIGYRTVNIRARARARRGGAQVLILDEDAIDDGSPTIQTLSFAPPRCGNGNPSVCVNDDIANIGLRTSLFTRGINITPYSGLVLSTGQVGDEGLFRFSNPDPQWSRQNGAQFTSQQFIDATGAAADENNLDKVDGVLPLGAADILALVDKTVCAVVLDSDVSFNPSPAYASLKGATLGVTAFRVTAAVANPSGGSYLPLITVDLLPSAEVSTECDGALPSAGTVTLTE